jgi:hypothetical protein
MVRVSSITVTLDQELGMGDKPVQHMPAAAA